MEGDAVEGPVVCVSRVQNTEESVGIGNKEECNTRSLVR